METMTLIILAMLAYTVYGKWGLEIWSQQTSKSIFNKRKTV